MSMKIRAVLLHGHGNCSLWHVPAVVQAHERGELIGGAVDEPRNAHNVGSAPGRGKFTKRTADVEPGVNSRIQDYNPFSI